MAINPSPPEIPCATGFKWRRREVGQVDKDRTQTWKAQIWNSGRDGGKEKTEEQKEGQDSSHGMALCCVGMQVSISMTAAWWLASVRDRRHTCGSAEHTHTRASWELILVTKPQSLWAPLALFQIHSPRCDKGVDPVLFQLEWIRKPGYPCHRWAGSQGKGLKAHKS